MGMVDMNMYESSGGQLVDVMISAERMGMVQAKCGFWMEKMETEAAKCVNMLDLSCQCLSRIRD